MQLPTFLLQFSSKGYRAAVCEGLSNAFDRSATEKTLAIDSGAPIVIFSDMHKGARDDADDYWRCERAYRAALAYYYEAGYDLFVLGDAEELWENTPDAVIEEHAETLELEAKFHAENRYIKFWGNHDDDWGDPTKVRDRLDPLFEKVRERLVRERPDPPLELRTPKPLEVRESLKLRLTHGGEPLGIMFLVHGHQGTLFSDTAGPVAKFFVKNVWGNVQRLTRLSSTTPATNWRLREKHDRAMAAWVRDFGADLDERLVLIAGHTHRPVFSGELLERSVSAKLDSERAEASPDRSAVSDLSAKLEWLQAWRRWRDPHEVGQPPAYFNTGCCAFPDGDITGLELVDGRIRLVRWPEREPQCEELAAAKLEEIFQNLATDGGYRERAVDGASVR